MFKIKSLSNISNVAQLRVQQDFQVSQGSKGHREVPAGMETWAHRDHQVLAETMDPRYVLVPFSHFQKSIF